MLYEATGELYEDMGTDQVTDNFKKREFVLKMEDNGYENFIKFQLTQNRCDALDSFKKGDELKVAFALSGKPFTNREGKTIYFTNLNVMKVEGSGNTVEDDNFNQVPPEESDPNMDVPPPGDDDLPF